MTLLNIGTGTFYGNGGYGSSITSNYGGYGYNNGTRVTRTDVNDLIRFIEDGNAKQVMEKYNQLNFTGNSTVRNRIENYFATQYGQDLTTTLEQSAGSSFSSGLKQGCAIFGLFDDGLSGDELESRITGVEESKGSKFAEYAGGVISSGASTAAIGAGIGFWIGGGPAGAAVGAVIGGIVGAVTGIFKVSENDKQNSKATANA